MDKLTDFVDTSDVSDAAIQWVLKVRYSQGATTVAHTREQSTQIWARPVIMAARLIQKHEPELLIDPDLKIAMAIAQKEVVYPVGQQDVVVRVALAAYKAGKGVK